MEKIDYGDINKFLVSIGIVLIGLSMLLPYFYLKEDFGLYIEGDLFQKYQEPVKELIMGKQNQVIGIQKMIPWTSLGLFLLGISSLVYGLLRWFRLQFMLDRKLEKEIVKLELEIVSLTHEEREEVIKQKVQEVEKLEPPGSDQVRSASSIPSRYFQDYLEVEKNISDVFLSYRTPYFIVFSQVKLENRFRVDLLIKSKTKKYSDKIIEIKYYNKKIPLQNVRDTINRLNTLISYYYEIVKTHAIPVLLIIINKEYITQQEIQKYQSRISEEYIKNLNKFKIQFIEETEIQKLNIQEILEL